MGVTMTTKGLSDLGQGRWEYRRRVSASAKKALGKGEWKQVIRARSDADLAQQYAQVVADFEREVAAATKPRVKLTPREAWEAALREADGLTLGAVDLTHEAAREVVAEEATSRGGSTLPVQALMDPGRSPTGFTGEDARRVYVEEKLGGGEGPEHRVTMVRLDRVCASRRRRASGPIWPCPASRGSMPARSETAWRGGRRTRAKLPSHRHR